MTVEKVDDLFVVDFQERSFDVKLSQIFPFLYLRKKLMNDLRNHSFFIAVHGCGVCSHGICFPT